FVPNKYARSYTPISTNIHPVCNKNLLYTDLQDIFISQTFGYGEYMIFLIDGVSNTIHIRIKSLVYH
ncbi:hypothetical protein ABE42_14560, partial [Bacillus thuringiensis]|nr:hypothetical protein [Bacillus thuringiensis]